MTKIRGVVAAGHLSRVADLPDELSFSRERKNLRVVGAVAGDPDAVLSVYADAVELLRPLVPGPGPPHVCTTVP